MKQTGFQSTCRKRKEKSPGSAQCSELLTCRPLLPAARGPSLLWSPEQAFQQMRDCQMSYVIVLPPVIAERLLNVWVLFSLAFRRSIARISAVSSCHTNCAFWRHLRKSTLQKKWSGVGFMYLWACMGNGGQTDNCCTELKLCFSPLNFSNGRKLCWRREHTVDVGMSVAHCITKLRYQVKWRLPI